MESYSMHECECRWTFTCWVRVRVRKWTRGRKGDRMQITQSLLPFCEALIKQHSTIPLSDSNPVAAKSYMWITNAREIWTWLKPHATESHLSTAMEWCISGMELWKQKDTECIKYALTSRQQPFYCLNSNKIQFIILDLGTGIPVNKCTGRTNFFQTFLELWLLRTCAIIQDLMWFILGGVMLNY